jgi:hypothetical protein
MDNSEYVAGMKDATGKTLEFRRQLADTNASLARTASISRGLNQVFSGQLVGGIRSIVEGLKGVPPAATRAVASLGSIAAAATAGWMAGKKLDSMLGLSEKISNWYSGGPIDKGAMTEGKRLRAQRQGRERAGEIDVDTEKERIGGLKGVEKLTAQLALDEAEAVREKAAVVSQAEKDAWDRRMTVLRQRYATEKAAIEQEEKDKADAIRKKQEQRERQATRQEAKVQERAAEEIARINEREFSAGRGVSQDQAAAMGGKIGAQRGGLAVADRQLQVAIETNKRQEEIARVNKEMNESLKEIRDRLTGGAE